MINKNITQLNFYNRFYLFSFFSRFEAEISRPSLPNMFIPSQVARPIIGSNTYSQTQQKLHDQLPIISVPPPPIMPSFIQSFTSSSLAMPGQHILPEKSYSTEPTPVVLSSAPKLYTNRPTVSRIEIPVVSSAPAVSFILFFLLLHFNTFFSLDRYISHSI